MKNKQSLPSSTLIVATFKKEGPENLVLFTDKPVYLVCKLLLNSDKVSYASQPIWKVHSCSDIISKLYKPAFHSSYLSCNIPYSSAATIWVFYLLQRRYSYLTQSSIMELSLFDSVFYNGVTPISISTLKPLLGIIGVLLLKLQTSPIISIYI